jgi:L-amino acid N-acyltransferase
MEIRLAVEDDLGAIFDIYHHYVAHSTCTYQYEPTPQGEQAAWLRAHQAEHPATVAVSGGRIVGYAALSPFRPRAGYRHTVEDAVYVGPDCHRRGIGRALLGDLVARARTLGHHTMLAGVSAEQEASLALHLAEGFREVARMREVGFKFGKWLDVVFLQLLL